MDRDQPQNCSNRLYDLINTLKRNLYDFLPLNDQLVMEAPPTMLIKLPGNLQDRQRAAADSAPGPGVGPPRRGATNDHRGATNDHRGAQSAPLQAGGGGRVPPAAAPPWGVALCLNQRAPTGSS